MRPIEVFRLHAAQPASGYAAWKSALIAGAEGHYPYAEGNNSSAPFYVAYSAGGGSPSEQAATFTVGRVTPGYGLWGTPRRTDGLVAGYSDFADVLMHALETPDAWPVGLENTTFVRCYEGYGGGYSPALGGPTITWNGITNYGIDSVPNGYALVDYIAYWDYALDRARKFESATGTYSDFTL